MRRALVTGGAGFIGSHLADELLHRGWDICALDDLSTGSDENVRHLTDRRGFRLVTSTVLDQDTVDELVRESDAVVHLAAAVGVERIICAPVSTIETNFLGTRNVLNAAARAGRRVLVVSSSEIYGKSEAVPFGENDDRVLGPTTQLRWSYAVSKAMAEHLALACHHETGTPVTVVRPFNTIGPRQSGRYGMVVPRLVGQARAGKSLTVYGDGRQTRSFCDVRDVARGLALVLDEPRTVGEVLNIGSSDEIEILELARRILRLATGVSAVDDRIAFVPYDQAYGPGFEDMRRRQPDISRIARLTGWRPTIPLEETLRTLLADP